MEEDALSGEVARRARRTPIGGGGELRTRPNSTGDVEAPSRLRLPSRFANNYQLDASAASNVRPHAPLSRTASSTEELKAEQDISRSLTALWNSLKTGGGEGNVQFLNIPDADDSYDFASTKQGAGSSRKKISGAPFSIPESPRGSLLVLNILSTWGDKHYLGLNGIEIFDMNGCAVQVLRIAADPADINVLPENQNDTRVVGNLLDGVNHTRDDLAHTWLCPFFAGRSHLITIEFHQPTTLSMIRVINYGKDRVHANRGARYMEISLDKRAIFKGEIKKNSGVLDVLDSDSCCECILFTTNGRVLAAIESNDRIAQLQLESEASRGGGADTYRQRDETYLELDDDEEEEDEEGHGGTGGGAVGLERPTTGNRRSGSQGSSRAQEEDGQGKQETDEGRRVYRRAQLNRALSVDLLRPSTAASARTQVPVRGRVLDLCLLSNWGDSSLVGLTGLCGMDANLEEMPLGVPEVLLVEGEARLSVLGRVALVEPPAALVNGINATTAVEHMWRTALPKQPGQHVALRFDLGRERDLKGLKAWNYNHGREGACCGVKHVSLYLDGRLLCTNLVARKAPGTCGFDYSQFLPTVLDKNVSRLLKAGARGHARSTADLTLGTTTTSSSASPSPPGKEKVDIWAEAEEHGIYEDLGGGGEGEDDDLEDAEHSPVDAYGEGPHSFGPSPGLCLTPQQWQTPVLPSGCIVKLVLQSTHGDCDYIGLNGMALLDSHGAVIPIAADLLQATPFRDVNDLQDIRRATPAHDARCLENLTNGSPNDTHKDRFMWLAPLSRQPTEPNTIFVLADRPLTISCVKLWNYSKHPARGVKELEVYVDDVLVFRGSLQPSPDRADMQNAAQRWGSADRPDLAQSILFTNDAAILRAEAARIPVAADEICFFDGGERRVELMQPRPATAVTRDT